MDAPDCTCLVRETIAYRESLDLSRPAKTRVVVEWYCSHPFHGLRMSLGDSPVEVQGHCSACALPHPTDDAQAAEPRASRLPESGRK
jgi:hypothetical protein